MKNPIKYLYQRCCIGVISLEEYRAFLISIDKFKDLNDTYINIARLKKPSFFVLHHDVHRDIDKMLELATLEHELGWRANYFLAYDEAVMQNTHVQKMLNMKHDVGLLYDMLDSCHRDQLGGPFRLQDQAWLRFQNALLSHLEFKITAIACHNRPGGLDNRELWKTYNYHTMNIRCDADMDFMDAEIVYFKLRGRKVQYLKRDCEGKYRKLRPWLKLWGMRDLGRRLKYGRKTRRAVLRIRWD